MPSPDLAMLQQDLMDAETRIGNVAEIYGRPSAEYDQALAQFSRLWFMARMKRRPEEFLN